MMLEKGKTTKEATFNKVVKREDTQGKWWMPRLRRGEEGRTRLGKRLVGAVQELW